MEKRKEPKELFDVMVPEKYKGNKFSRMEKSFLRAQPNQFGREVAEEYAARKGFPSKGQQ